jgi:hypothetical protein
MSALFGLLFGIWDLVMGIFLYKEDMPYEFLQVFNHCKFITFRKFVTTQTVSPDLLGEARFINVHKTHLFEEIRIICQSENPL